MSFNDIIGTIGVGLILLAYFFNIYNLIPKEGKLFFLMNSAGAGLACYASLLINYWPFVVLEGIWFLISVIGLIRVYRIRN
jgi:hypothetical protein